MPKISINISCFNRVPMLRQCIDSFIAQTYKDWELVLVDDGSRDDLSFVTKMDPRIKYYRQEHAGMAKGLNLAMEKSQGKYILPFGSDELALPPLLKETLACLEANPDYDVAYSDYWIRNRNGGEIRHKVDEFDDQKKAYQAMLEQQFIPHGGTLWLKDRCPEYDETMSPAEDWELMLTALESGVRFKHIPNRLWVYRKMGQPRMSDDIMMEAKCDAVLRRRGYRFNKETRRGYAITD